MFYRFVYWRKWISRRIIESKFNQTWSQLAEDSKTGPCKLILLAIANHVFPTASDPQFIVPIWTSCFACAKWLPERFSTKFGSLFLHDKLQSEQSPEIDDFALWFTNCCLNVTFLTGTLPSSPGLGIQNPPSLILKQSYAHARRLSNGRCPWAPSWNGIWLLCVTFKQALLWKRWFAAAQASIGWLKSELVLPLLDWGGVLGGGRSDVAKYFFGTEGYSWEGTLG